MALVIFIEEEKCSFQKLVDNKEVITPTHKLIATKRMLFTRNPRLTIFSPLVRLMKTVGCAKLFNDKNKNRNNIKYK